MHTAQDIVTFLRRIEGDGRGDVEKTVAFLLSLLNRDGSAPVPIAEFITVIKHEKPMLHTILKKRFQSNPRLQLLFQLELDYEQAKSSLERR